MKFKAAHILSCDQFDLASLERLCETADKMGPILARDCRSEALRGARLANLFFEPSTRTRISFSVAFDMLGGISHNTTGFQFSSIVKGESLADTARVISGYVDAIVLRHPNEGAVEEFAKHASVPVINGGDGKGEHPTQAFLDYYTLKKELSAANKTLDGRTFVFLGDLLRGRTIHSLLRLLSLHKNMRFVMCAPDFLALPDSIAQIGTSRGHEIIVEPELNRALSDADVIYVTRIQTERGNVEESNGFDPLAFRLDADRITRYTKPGRLILHPLPRDSSPGTADLADDITYEQGLRIFQQSDNGVPIRMALFALIFGVEDKLESSLIPLTWQR